MRDWYTLQEYVESQYGISENPSRYKLAGVLSDEVASGFGVKKLARVERDENEVKVFVYSRDFAAVPDVEDLPYPAYPDSIVTLPQYLRYGFSVGENNAWGEWGYSYDFVNYLYSVRCIKDE